MNMFEFQLLPNSEKIDQLYQNGVYIGKRKAGREVVLLYQLESFYIEVYYTRYRRIISHMYVFRSTTHLDPYLDQLPVESIESTK